MKCLEQPELQSCFLLTHTRQLWSQDQFPAYQHALVFSTFHTALSQATDGQSQSIPSGTVLLNWGTGVSANTDGNISTAAFHSATIAPTMRSDGQEILVIANNQIRRINTSAYTVVTIAGSGASLTVDGIGLNASIQNPVAIAYGTQNTYYLVRTAWRW